MMKSYVAPAIVPPVSAGASLEHCHEPQRPDARAL
jgi:hypothetical protein